MTTVAVTKRHDLTDAQRAVLEPLLPAPKKAGRPPLWTKRQLIDGIRWRVRAGAPWRDVPQCYGPWAAAYNSFHRWQRNGTWALILTTLQALADAAGRIVWDVSVDSTITHAHRTPPEHARTRTRRPNRPAGYARSRPITRWADPAAG